MSQKKDGYSIISPKPVPLFETDDKLNRSSPEMARNVPEEYEDLHNMVSGLM